MDANGYRESLKKLSLVMYGVHSKLNDVKTSDMPEINKKYAIEALEDQMKQLKDKSKELEEGLEKIYEEERQQSVEKYESGETAEKLEQEATDRRLDKFEAVNEFLRNNPELVNDTKGKSIEQIYAEHKDEINQIMLDKKNAERENVVEIPEEPKQAGEPSEEPKDEVDDFIKQFDDLTPVTDNKEDNSIEVDVDVVDEPERIDNTIVFDKDAFMAKENMADYTEDELNFVRNDLGKKEGEPLTEEDIAMAKVNLSSKNIAEAANSSEKNDEQETQEEKEEADLTPEPRKKVIAIEKAPEILTKAIDGIKKHKALAACAAIGVALVALIPGAGTAALGALAVGAGAEAVSEFNKGKKL